MLKYVLIYSLFFCSLKIFSQKIEVEKDERFDYLLQEKKKINAENNTNDRLRIQIYIGKLDDCKKEIENFKKNFSDLEGSIEFYHPAYKVLIGNFKTRIEAERNLILIRKKYTNAFIVKPRLE